MRILLLTLSTLVVTVTINAQKPQPTTPQEPPTVTRKVTPPFPAIAAARHISGAVLVDVDIDSKGLVTNAVAISGDKILRDVARKAAMFWQFNPSNDVVSRSVRLTFIFHDASYVPPEKKPDFICPYQLEIVRAAVAF